MLRRSLTATVSAAALSLGLVAAASAQTTLNGGGSTLVQPTIDQDFTKYSNANPSVLFSYDGVGSGTGQTAFLTNNISLFNLPAPAQYGTIVGTTVHFAASDATLSQTTQITPYNTGSGLGTVDGPLIQIPTVGTPITIPFNNSTVSKTLSLTEDQVCGVLSGQITNWNQLGAPAGQITVVYRSDSSGTTFLLTQHLNTSCTPSNSSFATYPVTITKTFASLFPAGFPAGSVFNGQAGSQNVANTLLATSQSIGYLSPDYTSIAPGSPSTTSLKVASLVNAVDGIAYQPSVKNTTLGLKSPGAGSTNATPPATKAAAADPTMWIPAIPTTKAGYPIVGYTTLDASSCYAVKAVGADLIGFLKAFYSSAAYTGVATNNGFVPLVNSAASRYVTAVTNTFLSNKSHYNLDIDDKAVCASTSKNGSGFAGR